jgi:hypothetical protein
MKNMILALALSACGSAFAAGIDLNVVPTNPVVITADFITAKGDLIRAPWVRNNYIVTTDRDLVINAMFWTIDLDGRQYTYELRLKTPVQVKAGASYEFKDIYLAQGPWLFNFRSYVSVLATGWIGTLNNPIGRLELRRDFETQ